MCTTSCSSHAALTPAPPDTWGLQAFRYGDLSIIPSLSVHLQSLSVLTLPHSPSHSTDTTPPYCTRPLRSILTNCANLGSCAIFTKEYACGVVQLFRHPRTPTQISTPLLETNFKIEFFIFHKERKEGCVPVCRVEGKKKDIFQYVGY
jgi:hypothetical protein